MVVLASKPRYCIHPEYRKNPELNVEEICGGDTEGDHDSFGRFRLLASHVACKYRASDRVRQVARSIRGIVDIEDLKTVCSKRSACPYFVAREMMNTSQIIFAPYNYVIDPGIRQAMGINLANTALLFDEAHNILSVARDSASVSTTLHNLHAGMDSFLEFIHHLASSRLPRSTSPPTASFHFLRDRLSRTQEWLYGMVASLPNHTEDSQFALEYGARMLSLLQQGLFSDDEDIKQVKMHYAEVQEWAGSLLEKATEREMKSARKLHALFVKHCGVLELLDEMMRVVEYVFEQNHKNVADFRVLIEKKRVKKPQGFGKAKEEEEKNTTFSILCLNAGIVFNTIKRKASSIILTSGRSIFSRSPAGTLSPLESFAMEMNVEFKNRVEGISSIDVKKQVGIVQSFHVALCDGGSVLPYRSSDRLIREPLEPELHRCDRRRRVRLRQRHSLGRGLLLPVVPVASLRESHAE